MPEGEADCCASGSAKTEPTLLAGDPVDGRGSDEHDSEGRSQGEALKPFDLEYYDGLGRQDEVRPTKVEM